MVGGAVRDFLTKNKIKDYDLTTDATNKEIEAMMIKNNISTKETGTRFLVQNVWLNNEWYEIATFREDSKGSDGRRPDSVSISDINGDAKRRDLTINALYYDIKTKEIVDLVGGLDDLKNRVVRSVGDPNERFEEDRIRILRAIRFTARIGSNFDPAIDKAIKNNNSLDLLAAEAIREEFLKGIKSAKSTRQYLSLLDRYGLFKWVLNGIKSLNTNFIDSNDEILVLSILLKDTPYSEIAKQLNGLKYSAIEIRPIQFLLAFLQTFSPDNFYTLKKLHNKSNVNDDTFKNFGQELGIDPNIINRFINFRLSMTGDYVKSKFGMKDGPELGDKIKELENQLFANN